MSEAGPVTKQIKRLLRTAIESHDPITRANACNDALKVIKDFEAEAVSKVTAISSERHTEEELMEEIGRLNGLLNDAIAHQSATRELPAELFDGMAVYVQLGVEKTVKIRPGMVADVLDAVVRLIRKNRRADRTGAGK